MSITTQAIYAGGVLRPLQPLALVEGEIVEVTIATATEPPRAAMSPEEWRQWVLSTAGKWQGDFERPEQGEVEEREPLS